MDFEANFYRLRAKYLYKFLKKHGCLGEYIDNIKDQYPSDRYLRVYEKHSTLNNLLVLLESDKFNIITSAFAWADTPQGHNFWNNLYCKFERELRMMYGDIRLINLWK